MSLQKLQIRAHGREPFLFAPPLPADPFPDHSILVMQFIVPAQPKLPTLPPLAITLLRTAPMGPAQTRLTPFNAVLTETLSVCFPSRSGRQIMAQGRGLLAAQKLGMLLGRARLCPAYALDPATGSLPSPPRSSPIAVGPPGMLRGDGAAPRHCPN
jgi:hypothetical protein